MATTAILLVKEEGLRTKPYYCKLRYPTIGPGLRIGPKNAPLSQYQFTMPDAVSLFWLDLMIQEYERTLKQHPTIGPAYAQCNEARQAILCSMAHQLGVPGLAAFRHTLELITAQRFTDASKEMLRSLWASAAQTPERAKRHAEQMRTGEWHAYYN